jgi:hypothetical protein
VKTLSGGISEALITTKFGLIVAIPSLLLHAFLSRKVHGVIGRMEASAVAFLNQWSRARLNLAHDRDPEGERSEKPPEDRPRARPERSREDEPAGARA